jgi:Holliday junction resolvasome RuvABC ATP-dependent DNA helicase subunit
MFEGQQEFEDYKDEDVSRIVVNANQSRAIEIRQRALRELLARDCGLDALTDAVLREIAESEEFDHGCSVHAEHVLSDRQDRLARI